MLDLELYILTEGKLDVIQGKFGPELDRIMKQHDLPITGQQAFELAVKTDPTPNNIYTQWVIYQLIRDPLLVYHSIDRLHNALVIFDKYKQRLHVSDIFQYKNIQQFLSAVDTIDTSAPASKKEEKRNAKAIGMDKLLDDQSSLVAAVNSKEAAQLVGKGTKWCVSADGESNEFNNYNSRGELFFIYNKQTKEKYMLFIGDEVELKNAANESVDYVDFALKNKTAVAALPTNIQFIKYLQSIVGLYSDVIGAKVDQQSKMICINFIKQPKYFIQPDDIGNAALLFIARAGKNFKCSPLIYSLNKRLGVDCFFQFGYDVDMVMNMTPDEWVGVFNDAPPYVAGIMYRYRSEMHPLSKDEELEIASKTPIKDLDTGFISALSSVAPLFKKVDFTSVGFNGDLNRIANVLKFSKRVLNNEDCYILMAFYSRSYTNQLIPHEIIHKIVSTKSIQDVYKEVQSSGLKLNRYMMDNIGTYFK